MTSEIERNDPGRFQSIGEGNSRESLASSRAEDTFVCAAWPAGLYGAPGFPASLVFPKPEKETSWRYRAETLRPVPRTASFEVLARKVRNDPAILPATAWESLAMELHPVEILNVASNQSPLVSGNEQALPATAFGGPAWEFGVGFSYAGVEGALAGLATSPSGKRPALWEAIAQGARRLYAPLRVALEGGVAFFEDLPSRLSGQLVPKLPEPAPLRVRGAVGAERTRRGPGVPRLSRLLVPLSEGGDVVLVMTVGRSGERAVTIQVETRDQRTGKPIASAFSMVDSESRRPVAQAERKSEAAAIFRGVAPGTALLVLETASGRWEVRLDLELKET